MEETFTEEAETVVDEIIDEVHEDDNETPDSEIKIPKFGTKVDLGSDDDYIIVDHSDDEVIDRNDYENSKREIFEDDVGIVNDKTTQKTSSEEIFEDNIDETSQKASDEEFGDDKVDLGSDEDYIYVDHSHDEEHVMDDEEAPKFDFADDSSKEEPINEAPEQPQSHKHKSNRGRSVKSFISDVIVGESKLENKEVETVKGEVMEEDEIPEYRPAPSDDSVVEAEIVDDDEELNIFNDESLGKYDDELERPSPKMDYTEGDELNIFTDSDLSRNDSRKKPNDVVGKAMEEFLDDVFDDEELKREVYKDDELFNKEETPQEDRIFDDEIREEAPQEEVIFDEEEVPQAEEFVVDDIDEQVEKSDDVGDGVTYYQGSNDVTSKLRKNNFYYEEERPRSVKESIKGIKRDMNYIHKSLKEIENPTHIDYVSVVDRTEEYDPNDYLSRPSDDDSDKIIQREEELTFAEKEEQRIEREMMMDALKKEISSDEDVIVPVHEQFRREELKDQALEDIISSANEDYKEIEKQRHRQDNQMKAFDDQILPGKRKMEDEIIDYVEVTDIGISSSDELYKQPIERVAKSITEIVDVEGPVHVNEVTKRVKDSCNIKRAGSTLKKRVNDAISEAENSGDIIRIGDFLYDASNNNIVIRKRDKPNIDLISDEEIAKSIETVLIHKPGITTGQIAKETSRNFGFRSTSKKTATRINSVLDLMIANNKVKIDNDIVELK